MLKIADKWPTKSQINQKFNKAQKWVQQNPPGFCDASSLLVSNSEGILSETVGDPDGNSWTVSNSENISSSLLHINALYSNLPITVTNAPDSALSSASASLVVNSAAQRILKLPKVSTLK